MADAKRRGAVAQRETQHGITRTRTDYRFPTGCLLLLLPPSFLSFLPRDAEPSRTNSRQTRGNTREKGGKFHFIDFARGWTCHVVLPCINSFEILIYYNLLSKQLRQVRKTWIELFSTYGRMISISCQLHIFDIESLTTLWSGLKNYVAASFVSSPIRRCLNVERAKKTSFQIPLLCRYFRSRATKNP